MPRAVLFLAVALILLGFSFAGDQTAQAQVPMAVTTYYPPTPVVTYLPERRGLFGQRLVYRPAVAYTAPATVMVPVAPAYVAPVAAPTTTYYAPAAPTVVGVPTTTYYAPAAPMVVVPPAPVTLAPVTVYRPVVVWP